MMLIRLDQGVGVNLGICGTNDKSVAGQYIAMNTEGTVLGIKYTGIKRRTVGLGIVIHKRSDHLGICDAKTVRKMPEETSLGDGGSSPVKVQNECVSLQLYQFVAAKADGTAGRVDDEIVFLAGDGEIEFLLDLTVSTDDEAAHIVTHRLCDGNIGQQGQNDQYDYECAQNNADGGLVLCEQGTQLLFHKKPPVTFNQTTTLLFFIVARKV
jgi:hypothetical protein